MFHLLQNISLRDFNTFGLSVNARYFLSIESPEDLILFFEENKSFLEMERFILGGGSNLLFLEDYRGLIVHPRMKGIRLVDESAETVDVEVGAGAVWDDFVAAAVSKGWGGVENLSLIPGHVGAVPVQNIGAYGAEAESVIHKVNVLNLSSFEKETFLSRECNFGYRTSVFKNQFKDQYLITSVVFRLKKYPELNLSYGALKKELSASGRYDIQGVREAVISIRESKLPDPGKIGNAGSFFKNPIVSNSRFLELTRDYNNVPVYPCGDDSVKLAAGWLIEQAGWKGKGFGNAAVHDKQALVLINRGNATGEEIYALSEKIRADILLKFHINLVPEVVMVGKIPG